MDVVGGSVAKLSDGTLVSLCNDLRWRLVFWLLHAFGFSLFFWMLCVCIVLIALDVVGGSVAILRDGTVLNVLDDLRTVLSVLKLLQESVGERDQFRIIGDTGSGQFFNEDTLTSLGSWFGLDGGESVFQIGMARSKASQETLFEFGIASDDGLLGDIGETAGDSCT
jgi:hypothetical protein